MHVLSFLIISFRLFNKKNALRKKCVLSARLELATKALLRCPDRGEVYLII